MDSLKEFGKLSILSEHTKYSEKKKMFSRGKTPNLECFFLYVLEFLSPKTRTFSHRKIYLAGSLFPGKILVCLQVLGCFLFYPRI